MYTPYVRGKQFELLALKELSVELGEHPAVRPVIEPVRAKGDALIRCLDELAMFNVQTSVILNPSVGELAGESNAPQTLLAQLEECVHDEHLRLGVQVRAGLDATSVLASISESALRDNPVDLVHFDFTGSSGIQGLSRDTSLQLAEDKSFARRYRPRLEGGQIRLKDHFAAAAKKTNLEYVGAPPSLFTDDNVYFAEDGFAGWGDYATIGTNFSEGGSSPRAVVIHLTYLDRDDGAIWLRHFSSDSNEDTSDTAGKFGEALEKLVAFCDGADLRNRAIDSFRTYHEKKSYPGLGMVKKLSLQNHILVAMDSLGRQR